MLLKMWIQARQSPAQVQIYTAQNEEFVKYRIKVRTIQVRLFNTKGISLWLYKIHLGKTATLSCDKYRADHLISISEDIHLISFTETLGGKQNSSPPCNCLHPLHLSNKEQITYGSMKGIKSFPPYVIIKVSNGEACPGVPTTHTCLPAPALPAYPLPHDEPPAGSVNTISEYKAGEGRGWLLSFLPQPTASHVFFNTKVFF